MTAPDRSRCFYDRFYTDRRDPRQTFDLVIPRSAAGRAGLVLCIHGGGWTEGSKDEYTGSLTQVSEEHGLAAACLNYRYVSETVSFRDQLDDISAALAAVKETGKTCGVDFDRVLLTGISAGGHLSLLYAYARRDEAPVRPVCVVSLCGPTDLEDGFYFSGENLIARSAGPEYFPRILGFGAGCGIPSPGPGAAAEALRRVSPLRFVGRDTVPTVFGHGERDEIVPYRNALDLDAKLTECGVEHTFVSFPDSGHGCEDGAAMARLMRLFFRCAETYLK